MHDTQKAPGGCNRRGARTEVSFEKPDPRTSRRPEQGLIRVATGIVIHTGNRALAFRLTPEGVVQIGGVLNHVSAALAALSGGGR